MEVPLGLHLQESLCCNRLHTESQPLPPSEHTQDTLPDLSPSPFGPYCSVVLHPCSQALSQSIESIQNYAMRVILRKPPGTPSAPLRIQLGWSTLHKRHQTSVMCQVHRCVLHQAPTHLNSKFVTNSCYYSKTRGADKLHLSQPRTEKYRQSFAFQSAFHYNQLPQCIRSKPTLQSFKHALMSM